MADSLNGSWIALLGPMIVAAQCSSNDWHSLYPVLMLNDRNLGMSLVVATVGSMNVLGYAQATRSRLPI